MANPAYNPNSFTPYFLKGVVESRPTKEAIKKSYIGTSILPLEEVWTWKITWDEYRARNPLAGIYAADGHAVPGQDERYSTHFAEVANIMYTRSLRQDEVMTLREAGELGVRTTADRAATQKAMQKLQQRMGECDDSVDSTLEYLIMHALQGSIPWPPLNAAGGAIANPPPHWGKVAFTLSMGFRASFIQNVTTLTGADARVNPTPLSWKNPAANPILDLEIVAQLMTRTLGQTCRGSTIVLSEEVFSYIAFNTSLLNWVKGTERGTNLIAPAEFIQFLQTKFGWQIRFYDAAWTYEYNLHLETPTQEVIPFLPRGKVLIIPPGPRLGYTANAVHQHSDGQYRPGKNVWSYRQPTPPHDEEVGVGMFAFPIMERLDSFVLDVYN